MGSLVFKCGWLAAWQWSAGDLCNGKKDATCILAQDVYAHTLATQFKSAPLDIKTNCCWKSEMCSYFDSGELLYMCQSCQRSSLCLFYSSVSDKSQHSAAAAHWPKSLKCKYKHKCEHARWQAHVFKAFAQAHARTQRSACKCTDAHGCKYSHPWTRSNPHKSRMKDVKLPYIHQMTLGQVAAFKNPSKHQ